MGADLSFNRYISQLFFKKAKVLSERGEQYKFRSLSYLKAAYSISKLNKSLIDIYQQSWLVGLQNIHGVGVRLSRKIEKEIKKRN